MSEEHSKNSDEKTYEDQKHLATKMVLDKPNIELDVDLKVIEKERFFKRAWKWLTEDKGRLGSVIFLFLFVVLIIVLAALNLNMGQIMVDITNWFRDKITIVGIYVGVFVIAIFGNFTVIFPIPYTIAIIAIARDPTTSWYEIIILGISAGLGAAIGEIVAWFTGKASKKIIQNGMHKQIARAEKWIQKKLAPLMIFLFAALPLPDDALLIYLGFLNYALWKTVLWCSLGKIVLTTSTGLASKYLGGTIAGKWILWAFGLDENGLVGTPPPIWISALTWILTIVVIGLLLFIDWSAIYQKISHYFLYPKYKRLVKSNELDTKMASIIGSEESIDANVILSKDASFWQCSIRKEQGKEAPAFFDFLTTSYVVGKSTNVLLKADWFEKLEKNISTNQFNNIKQYKIDKIIPPKDLSELYQEEGKLAELINKMMLISLTSKHPESNEVYNVSFLLEKVVENQLKVRCISEREGLIIKKLKNIPSEILVNKLILLLDNLSDTPQLIKKVKLAY